MTPEMRALLERVAEIQVRRQGRVPLAPTQTGGHPNPDVWLLPLCPPVNNLFPGKARRYRSKKYVEWTQLAEAWWLAQLARKRTRGGYLGQPPCTFPLAPKTRWGLDVYVFMPTWRDGDLDGRLKACLDFLCVATGHDDRYLVSLYAERITNGERLSGIVAAFRGT